MTTNSYQTLRQDWVKLENIAGFLYHVLSARSCVLVFFLQTVVLLLEASALNVLEDFDFSIVQLLSGDGHACAG